MTDDLIDCFGNCEKLMPFLHLPVQSGSDRILKLMNRKHHVKFYLSNINKLQKVKKGIKISSDFIIGYPGETKKDFEDTIHLVKKVGFVNSYSFIFSPRPGTPSANMKLNNHDENQDRLKQLQNLLDNIQIENNKKYLEKNCKVLIENKLKNQNKYFGRTKHMLPVIFESNNCKLGNFINVKINSYNRNNLFSFCNTNKVKAA